MKLLVARMSVRVAGFPKYLSDRRCSSQIRTVAASCNSMVQSRVAGTVLVCAGAC